MELWWNLACDSLPFHPWIQCSFSRFLHSSRLNKAIAIRPCNQVLSPWTIPVCTLYSIYIHIYMYIQHPLLHTMHYKGHAPQCMICITAGIIYISLFALVVGSWPTTYQEVKNLRKQRWHLQRALECIPQMLSTRLGPEYKTKSDLDVLMFGLGMWTSTQSSDLFCHKHQI